MPKILAVTSLTSRFQATVPKEVRKLLKLTDKDKIVWLLESDKIIIEKA